MKRDIAKIIGYPAFILLGAAVVELFLGHSSTLFLSGIAIYFVGVVMIAFDPAILRVPHAYLRLSAILPALILVLLYVFELRELGPFLFWLPQTAITICFFVVRQRDPWWKAQEERAYARVFGRSRSGDL